MSFDPSTIMRLLGGMQGGQGAGGMLDAGFGFAATAALTPFLGPLAPIVGPIVGKFLGKLIGGKLKDLASMFNFKPKATEQQFKPYERDLDNLYAMGAKYDHLQDKASFARTGELFRMLDKAIMNGDKAAIGIIRSEIKDRMNSKPQYSPFM